MMPIPLLNLIPVVADAESGAFTVGASQIRARISKRTCAIVVAHIGGEPVDMEPVLGVAGEYGLPVIEDCSQAHGAVYRGQLVGTLAHAAVYSTMSGKHHCTGGQGGVIYTRDPELCERARLLRDRGKVTRGGIVENVTAALNLNGNDLAGAIGRSQLRKLPARLARRRALARQLTEGCSDLATAEVVPARLRCESAYWFVRVRLDLSRLSVTKATYLSALRAEGIPCGTWADMPATQEWFVQRRTPMASPSGSWLFKTPGTSTGMPAPDCRTRGLRLIHT